MDETFRYKVFAGGMEKESDSHLLLDEGCLLRFVKGDVLVTPAAEA
jgi:hypothetical protein